MLAEKLSADVQGIIEMPLPTTMGATVPTSFDVLLAGGAVEIEATLLYANLAHSSEMATELDSRITARLMMAFLAATSNLIRHNDGATTSFNGD